MNPTDTSREGPLQGLKVVEVGAIGPAPFACMLLADLGADIVTLVRPGSPSPQPTALIERGRKRVITDLKQTSHQNEVLRLLEHADILIEGFRPGVMERLNLGPDRALATNPRLIYGRMTGWGQTGPLAPRAGHDINYISLAGALDAIGAADGPPQPPLNLVGDYGGGSLFLLLGILSAVIEREHSGKGQVVDAAILDGTAALMSLALTQWQRGSYSLQRGSNVLDGSSPHYGTYLTADDKYLSVGPIEPQFFRLMCERLQIPSDLWTTQNDSGRRQELKNAIAKSVRQRTRQEWQDVFEGTDACVTPVLNLKEAIHHPHNQARKVFEQINGVWHAGVAPRLSRTPGKVTPVSPESHSLSEMIHNWS